MDSKSDKVGGGVSETKDEKLPLDSIETTKKKKKKQKKRSKSREKDPNDVDEVKDERGRSKSPSKAGRGGSRSRSRGRSRDKSRGRSASRSASPKKKGIPKKNLKLEPSEWSREEMMEKIKKLGNFKLDRVTGSGLLEVRGKRILTDEIEVLLETFRRFNEIQRIVLQKCSVNDELIEDLCKGMKYLRHLRFLDLSNNAISKNGVMSIIKTFASMSRKLEILDLRQNNLTEDDGRMLYRSFPTLMTLNGLPIAPLKKDKDTFILDMTDQKLKLPEVGIVCSLLFDCRHVSDVRLAKNSIDARGLCTIAECIRDLNYISKIDLSFNPLKFPDENLMGFELLQQVCMHSSHICEIKFDGVTIPKDLLSLIQHSLMVNRSIRGSASGYRFNKFCEERISTIAPPPPTNALADWKPEFSIDYIFSTINRIPEKSVEVRGDEIHIVRRERKKVAAKEF